VWDRCKKKILARIARKYKKEKGRTINCTILCKQFGLSRQGYYKLLERDSKEATMSSQVKEMVKQLRKRHTKMGCKKVHKKLKVKLKEKGIYCSRDKMYDILREGDMLIKKRKRYVNTTQSYHRFYKHKNLIKDKEIASSEQVWVSDITYIKTKEKSLYLSLITDVYSKQIMGWELSDNLKTVNCIKAMKMAVSKRQYNERELIHHSDRGFQYCHPDYIKLLNDNNIKVSMTTKHDPYENAVAERVNGILKDEYAIESFTTEKEAYKEIRAAIWLYNTDRPHLSCGYMTPHQAHNKEGYKLKKWPGKKRSRDMSLDLLNN
jgi:putative transposase